MSRTTLLTAAVFLLALALVVVLVTRPSTPSLQHAAPTVLPAPSVAAVPSPDPADSALATDSTDSVVTGFIASFRSSSVAACQTSLVATLKSTDPGVADNAAAICGCASDRVVTGLTVGEVHAATLSAVGGDAATNPTIQALKARFSDATKACLLNQTH